MDAFEQFLEQRGLLDLHRELEQVGYRIRAVSWDVIDIECTARDCGPQLLRCDIHDARAFLAQRKKEIGQR